MKYYDEDGNEFDFGLEPEALKKALSEREELVKLKDGLETKEKELLAENEKLKSKDFNFSKLRKASEQERQDMLKGFNSKERALIEQIDGVKGDLDAFKERTGATRRNNILSGLAGNDADLRKQLEDTYKGFAGEPKDEKEEYQRYINAFTIVKGSRPDIDTLNAYVPSTVTEEFKPAKGTDWTRTPEGEAFYKENFPKLAEDKK